MNTKYKEAARELTITNYRIPYLFCEFFLLFIAAPFFIYWQRNYMKFYLIPTIVITGLVFLIILLLDPEFNRRRLWNTKDLRNGSKEILKAFVPGCFLVTALMPLFFPELLFSLPNQNFQLWLLLMFIYPIFSVYPQEIIYRVFVFHRYREIFSSKWSMILASSVGFSLAHLFFGNWIAIVGTFLAGILFGYTYHRSESCLQASIEHSIWGNFAFTVGIGWFFFSGSI